MNVTPSAKSLHSEPQSLAGVIAPYQNVAIASTLTEPTDVVNVQEGDVVHVIGPWSVPATAPSGCSTPHGPNWNNSSRLA